MEQNVAGVEYEQHVFDILVGEKNGQKAYLPADEASLKTPLRHVPMARVSPKVVKYTCAFCGAKVQMGLLKPKPGDPKKEEAFQKRYDARSKWQSCPDCRADYEARNAGSHMPEDFMSIVAAGVPSSSGSSEIAESSKPAKPAKKGKQVVL